MKFKYFLMCAILSFTYVNGFSMAIADSPYSAGRVYNGSGTQTGSISADGRVYNGSGTQTGSISSDGRMYNGSGTQTGSISSDGRMYNGSGTQTGSISSDGRVYNGSGTQTGSISSDGRVYNSSGQEIGQVPPGNPAVAFGMLSGGKKNYAQRPSTGLGSADDERGRNAILDRAGALKSCVALYRDCHLKKDQKQCHHFAVDPECKAFSAQEIQDGDDRIFTFEDYKCSQAHDACFQGTNVNSSSCQYIAHYCQSPGTDRVLKEVKSGKNKAPFSQEENCREGLRISCDNSNNIPLCHSAKKFCTKYLADLKKKREIKKK